jgi:hypothetical protein
MYWKVARRQTNQLLRLYICNMAKWHNEGCGTPKGVASLTGLVTVPPGMTKHCYLLRLPNKHLKVQTEAAVMVN